MPPDVAADYIRRHMVRLHLSGVVGVTPKPPIEDYLQVGVEQIFDLRAQGVEASAWYRLIERKPLPADEKVFWFEDEDGSSKSVPADQAFEMTFEFVRIATEKEDAEADARAGGKGAK